MILYGVIFFCIQLKFGNLLPIPLENIKSDNWLIVISYHFCDIILVIVPSERILLLRYEYRSTAATIALFVISHHQ